MKSTLQLIQDARHVLDALADDARFIESGRVKNRISALEKENADLKKQLETSHRSAAAYHNLYDRKNKECLRKVAELNNKKREIMELERELIYAKTDFISAITPVKSTPKDFAIALETQAAIDFNRKYSVGETVQYEDINVREVAIVESIAVLSGGLIAMVKINLFPNLVNTNRISKIYGEINPTSENSGSAD